MYPWSFSSEPPCNRAEIDRLSKQAIGAIHARFHAASAPAPASGAPPHRVPSITIPSALGNVTTSLFADGDDDDDSDDNEAVDIAGRDRDIWPRNLTSTRDKR